MAENWYPQISEELCTSCGICTKFAQCGTFDDALAPKPVVVKPVACVDHCHGCGNRCPKGAITYVGDDTGWIPPALRPEGADMDDVY